MSDNKKLYQKANAIANYKIRSASEAREKGRKGGIASGETRRRNAELRKTLETLLDSKATSFTLPDNPVFGSMSEDHSVQSAIICALIYRALKGETGAINTIAWLLGGK